MSASNLLTLIDDIATLLDDIAVMTKVAGQKTAGVLGDDLALNAEQVAGVASERELTIVWSVFKGSLINKLILVPTALALSALLPKAIVPLLSIGGTYLCYEGFEKIIDKFFHKKSENNHVVYLKNLTPTQLANYEKTKIKGAIRTDFILSAEIIIIALGVVAETTLLKQSIVLSLVALIMTLFVYGLVAGIVKIDDLGLWMLRRNQKSKSGLFLIRATPWLMKGLGLAGTVAMFLVGGGILVHSLHLTHETLVVLNLLVGVLAGAISFFIVLAFSKLKKVIK